MANETAATYSIWLSTPTGQRIKFIDPTTDVTRLEYVRVVNAPGVLVMRLRPDFSQIFQEDSRLEILRKLPEGMILDTDTIWFIRDWDEVFTEQREEYIEISAVSAMDLLDSRIVAYAAGSSQASKSGPADDLMKAIVRENLGNLATDTDRDLSAWLSVEPDRSAGPSTAAAFSRKQVLATLQDLSLDSVNAGSGIYFDIDGELVFKTFAGQRGLDHGLSSGKRITLSPNNGTLTDVRRSHISSDERNFIYVGGQGEEADRQIETASDAARIALSPFNRRELFVDARNTDSTAAMQAEARAALREWRPRGRFSGKIVDTPALRYGRDWNFGDRVVVQHRDFVAEALVNEIRVLLERGQETIRAGLSVEG